MNLLVLVAGIISLIATIGHFTMGRKLYLRPLLKSELDPIVKTIFKSLFHYSSVYLLLSTFFLIRIGIAGSKCLFDPFLVLAFICANFILMGVWQIILALRSGIEKPLANIFQWLFWLIIGGLILVSLI